MGSNIFNKVFPQGGTGLHENSRSAEVTTTNATATDAITVSLGEGQAMHIEASAIARGSGGDNGSYHVGALFYRAAAGNVTREGPSTLKDSHFTATANWDFDILADTTNQTVDVRVTGEAGITVKWTVIANYTIQPY